MLTPTQLRTELRKLESVVNLGQPIDYRRSDLTKLSACVPAAMLGVIATMSELIEHLKRLNAVGTPKHNAKTGTSGLADAILEGVPDVEGRPDARADAAADGYHEVPVEAGRKNWRPAQWFNPDGPTLSAHTLRKSGKSGRVERRRPEGAHEWKYSVDSVSREWPEHAHRIHAKLRKNAGSSATPRPPSGQPRTTAESSGNFAESGVISRCESPDSRHTNTHDNSEARAAGLCRSYTRRPSRLVTRRSQSRSHPID